MRTTWFPLCLASLLLAAPADAQRCRRAEDQRFDTGPAIAVTGDLDLSGDRAAVSATDAGGAPRVDFYRFDGTSWVADGGVPSPAGPIGELALEGDVAVVGHPFDSSVGTNRGSASVLSRASGGWSHVATLTDPLGSDFDQFGWSVALSGDVLLVGSRFGDAPALDSGKVTVFRRVGGAWTYEASLGSADLSSFDDYGSAVATDGTVVAASAINYASGHGAVWVHRWNGTTWQEEQRLDPPFATTFLEAGRGLDVEGDTLVMGIPVYPQFDPGPNAYGVAQVWEFAGSWVERPLLVPDAPWPQMALGSSVSLDGDVVVLGGPATFGGQNPGTARVFLRVGAGHWVEWTALEPSDGQVNDWFGATVAVDGPWVWVHAPANGDAAYVHSIDAAVPGVVACNGAGTNPEVLASAGPPVLGATWTGLVDVSSTPGATLSALLAYTAPVSGVATTFGELLVAPEVAGGAQVFASLAAPVAGIAAHPVAVPSDPALTGFTCFAQAGLLGVGTPVLTNSLTLVAGP